jgi:hypothetical protein
MIVDGQLLWHELRTVEWEKVGEFCIVPKGKNSSCWTSLREKIFWPEMTPTVAIPRPGPSPIATESVNEDDTSRLAGTVGRAVIRHTQLLPLRDRKEGPLVRIALP